MFLSSALPELFELSLFYNPPKTKYFDGKVMYSYVNDVFYCPLIEIKDFKYSIYQQTETNKPDVFNENYKLKLKKKEILLTKGEIIYLKKFEHILMLDKTKPFFCLALVSKLNTLNYSWEYDASTLRPTRIASVNINFGRTSVTVKILSKLGNDKSIKLLLKLCEHESHVVRWDSVRSLIQLDLDEGMKILKEMICDDHLEIRSAARKSLKLLNI